MTPSHINPAQHKQLFLDDHAIASRSNVKRTLHQPDKHGPILKADRSRDQGICPERKRTAMEL